MSIPSVLVSTGILIFLGSLFLIYKEKAPAWSAGLFFGGLALGVLGAVWSFAIYAPGAFLVGMGVILFFLGYATNPGYGSGALGSGLVMTLGVVVCIVGALVLGGTYGLSLF